MKAECSNQVLQEKPCFGPKAGLMADASVICQKGFTLVELLAVVAVVALLASLFLPVIVSGKAMVHRVKCASNLRQLGAATQMYWDEHDGKAFRYWEGSTNGGDIYWFGWLEQWNGVNEGQRNYDISQGALFPYLQGQGVELCPSLNYGIAFKFKASGASYGYGYNWHLSRPRSQSAFPVSQIRDVSSIALFADAAQVNTFQYPASPDNPLLEEFYYIRDGEPTAHFRHRKRINIVYCDGHVDAVSPYPGSVSPTTAAFFTGRLPARMLKVSNL